MIIWNLFLLSAAVFMVSNFLPGIRIENYGTAIIVAVVYSIINFLLGWVLVFLSFPLILITFGLFNFVINAFMLWITDKMIDGFEIQGAGTTLFASFLISVIYSILRFIFQRLYLIRIVYFRAVISLAGTEIFHTACSASVLVWGKFSLVIIHCP